jgi:hypothetical protein
MYYSDEYFIQYYNDPEFAKPPIKRSNHSMQRKKERIPKTHLGESSKDIIINNTIVTTIINKPKNIIPIQEKIKMYLYCNKISNCNNIGAIIGKKGVNLKTLKYKVECKTFDKDFNYTIHDNTIYILANNKNTLDVATNTMNSNILFLNIKNNKK